MKQASEPVSGGSELRVRHVKAPVAFLLALALALAVPAGAGAAPVDSKRAQAVRVRAQVEQLDQKVEIAAEDYNEANLSYQAVTARVKKSEARLKTLTARQKELQKHLDVRVSGMYRSGPMGVLELLLGASSFEEFATTWDVLSTMNEQDAADVAALKSTRAQVEAARAQLKKDQAKAKAERDVMLDRKRTIEKQLAERKRMLAGLESEIARLEAQEAARERASWHPTVDYGNPSKSPNGSVVAIALSKLGAPYRWGAAGPDAFDCSGFTMWVYAQVGISLPHSSRAQIGVGERVSRANLQPGDLVFFGRSRIHHVGIYIGGGKYVHAPHTGDVVKISSLDRSDYAGACRP
ncbi:MAG: NlpC/P60 family protein [Actinomycetia bacterium]|nr:NlpC/P60 family protein [Actinomycetes bacterium]